MSADVTIRRTSPAEKIEWAQALAPSGLLPAAYRGKPANLFLAAEYADALGIERINAVTSIHVIEGKPSASADLIAALVRRAGHRLRITGDDRHARAVLIRADDPDFEYVAEWDLDKARAAGLVGKDVWRKFPTAMLRSRAVTEVARAGASEALLGVIYTPEELGEDVDAAGAPVRPVHVSATVTAAEVLGEDEAAAVEDAEVVEVPPQHAAPEIRAVTDRQNRRMHALFRELDITDHGAQLAGIGRAIGREVTSKKDLTESEAAFVIEALEARRAARVTEQPPAPDAGPSAGGEDWPPVAESGGGES